MSKITIIPADGAVGINGNFEKVDLTDIDAEIHAIQFDDGTGSGHIEYVNNIKPNKPIGKTAFRPFEKYITRWKSATTPPERTLDDAKLDARNQINGRRDTLEASGFPYLGKTFDSDQRSVQRISTAVQAAQAAAAVGQPFAITWTAQDNTTVDLDVAGMMGMPVALAQYAAQFHEHAKTKKAAIEAATTIAEVDAIQW